MIGVNNCSCARDFLFGVLSRMLGFERTDILSKDEALHSCRSDCLHYLTNTKQS